MHEPPPLRTPARCFVLVFFPENTPNLSPQGLSGHSQRSPAVLSIYEDRRPMRSLCSDGRALKFTEADTRQQIFPSSGSSFETTCCVTPGKSPTPSESQFPLLSKGANNTVWRKSFGFYSQKDLGLNPNLISLESGDLGQVSPPTLSLTPSSVKWV